MRKAVFLLSIILSAFSASTAKAESIIAFGRQVYDSSDFPLEDIVAIAAGDYHSLALKSPVHPGFATLALSRNGS